VDEQPSLGQLIWLVRRELEWAHDVDADHPLRFDVGSVEVETDVAISRVRKGEAGLDVKVLGFGGVRASGSQQSTEGSTSRVRLTLTPRDVGGGTFDVSALDTEPPPRRAGEPEGRGSSS
jgi:hypothetical protein